MRTVKPLSLSIVVCALVLVAFMFAKESAGGSYGGTKWDYLTMDPGELIIDERLTEEEIKEAERRGIQKARSLEDKLNRVGANGWELAVCTPSVLIFKRPTR